jgi:hypothetical protein
MRRKNPSQSNTQARRFVRSEKVAAIPDKSAALQVEWNVVPCHRQAVIRWHPQIEAL